MNEWDGRVIRAEHEKALSEDEKKTAYADFDLGESRRTRMSDIIDLGFGMTGAILDISRETETNARLDAACLVDGVLQAMPAEFYAGFSQNDLSVWCMRRGFYCLPTLELVDFVREQIAGEKAIEIGAGHGALGRALGIPTTDSHQQSRPEVVAHYARLNTAVVRYPMDVEKLTAMQAVEKYQPTVVLACWVTHRYHPVLHARGGNMDGVDEPKLLAKASVLKYVFVGHERTHANKVILKERHETFRLPFLFSRAMDSGNVAWVWGPP